MRARPAPGIRPARVTARTYDGRVYDAPSTLPALLLALVLVVSGVAKLMNSRVAVDAFVGLRLPRVLLRLKAPQLLPIGELVIAALLLVTSGPLAVVVAVGALALFIAYLVVIVRALTFDEPVTCSCFGELGLGAVDVFTAVRNVVLVALAALGVWSATHDNSVLQRMGDFDGGDWTWLAGVLGAIVLTWLITGEQGHGRGHSSRAPGGSNTHPHNAGQSAGTHPTETVTAGAAIPDVALVRPDGTNVPLSSLSQDADALLLVVSPTCGSCVRVIEKARTWQRAISDVRTVLVLPSAVSENYAGLVRPEDFDVLFDPDFVLAAHVGGATPAAVLFGADGRVASALLSGDQSITTFMDGLARSHGAESSGIFDQEGDEHEADEWVVYPDGDDPRAASHASTTDVATAPMTDPAFETADDDEEDYLARPTPFALLKNAAGGTVRLIQLGDSGPAVVLYVSPTCGSCLDVIAAAPRWEEQLRGVPVYYLVTGRHPAETLTNGGIDPQFVLVDENMAVGQMMEIGTPSMFAVGPGRMLLAGPVSGSTAVAETMEQIIAEVSAVRPGPADSSVDVTTDDLHDAAPGEGHAR